MTTAFPSTTDVGFSIPQNIISFRQSPDLNQAIDTKDFAAGRALLKLINSGKKHVTANLATWLQEKINAGKTQYVILLLQQLSR